MKEGLRLNAASYPAGIETDLERNVPFEPAGSGKWPRTTFRNQGRSPQLTEKKIPFSPFLCSTILLPIKKSREFGSYLGL